MIREEIYQKALSFVGVRENPKNSNNVIFNTDYYGHPVSGSAYAWCCVFCWDVYRMCKASSYFFGGGKTASCTTLLNWYRKNRNKWVHRDITRMKRGDLVFYQFDSDPNAEHIGIFEKVIDGKNFYAIEGNTNSSGSAEGDGVYRKKRPMSKVLAFVSIEFADDVKKDTNPYPEPTKTVYRKTINIPNDDTRWVQWELVESKFKVDIDGKFGKATETAVKSFQSYHGLTVDGRVGPETRSKLKQ